MGKDRHGAVSKGTRQAEEEEARAPHRADREATPEEEAALPGDAVDPEVREHYEEMMERGVHQEGEGKIN